MQVFRDPIHKLQYAINDHDLSSYLQPLNNILSPIILLQIIIFITKNEFLILCFYKKPAEAEPTCCWR